MRKITMIILITLFLSVNKIGLAETDPVLNEIQQMDTGDIVNSMNIPPETPAEVKIIWVKATEVSLAWKASAGATHYNIYLNDELYMGSNTNSAILSELEPDTEYSVYVEAVSSNGVSAPSETVTFKTMPPAPGPVKNVDISITGNSVSLSWSPSPENEKVMKYNIYLDNVKIAETEIPNVTINDLSYGKHNIEIRAENEFMEGPGYICDIEITTLEKPLLTLSNRYSHMIIITWKAVKSAVRYRVFINDAYLATTEKTQYEVNGLESDKTYNIKVIAEDELGNTSEPAAMEVKTTKTTERISFGNVFSSIQEYIQNAVNSMIVLFAIGGAFVMIRSARIPFIDGRWRI